MRAGSLSGGWAVKGVGFEGEGRQRGVGSEKVGGKGVCVEGEFGQMGLGSEEWVVKGVGGEGDGW